MKPPSEKNALFEVSLKFIIKNDAGEVLVLKMPAGGPMGGYYDLPGGRIRDYEKSEPFHKIISREIKEELGTKADIALSQNPVAVGRHSYPRPSSDEEGHIFWIFFEGNYKGGELQISSEHDGCQWVNLGENNIDKYFVRGPWEGMYHYFHKSFPKELKE